MGRRVPASASNSRRDNEKFGISNSELENPVSCNCFGLSAAKLRVDKQKFEIRNPNSEILKSIAIARIGCSSNEEPSAMVSTLNQFTEKETTVWFRLR